MPTLAEARALFDYLRSRALDLRVEVIIADLVANGYAFDDFLIRPVGLFMRNYRRDVGKVTTETLERSRVLKLAVEVHREGLYDTLPQELFHHPKQEEPRPESRSVVENMRVQRRKEWAARQFFLPFEQEFYHQRVQLELLERRYFTNLPAYWDNALLADFWGLPKVLPARQVVNFLHLLPLAHRIVGDRDLTRLCFESVLEQSVRLRTLAPMQHEISPSLPAGEPLAAPKEVRLGQAELGRDFMLAGFYQETLPALEISLEALSPEALEAFLAAHTWQAQALTLLCAYFIPFETDVVMRYHMADRNQDFVLSADAEAPVLGFAKMQL